MKKIILSLIIVLCSCVKLSNDNCRYTINSNCVIQERNDTLYYYKVIDAYGLIPVIDTVHFAKQYYLKEK